MICQQCGEEYIAYGPDVRKGRAKHCSHACSARANVKARMLRAPNKEEVFKSRVDIKTHDECWLWKGKLTSKGYARMAWYGGYAFVHRIAFEVWVGPIPDGFDILHACDVGACCNPSHLSPGTHADNMADMAAKGRAKSLRGEASKRATITAVAVREIRAFYDGHPLRNKGASLIQQLADKYSVSKRCVQHIVYRTSWKQEDCHE